MAAEDQIEKERKVGVEPIGGGDEGISSGTVIDADDDLLRHIGYKQVSKVEHTSDSF